MPPNSRWTKAELIQEVRRLQERLNSTKPSLIPDTQPSTDGQNHYNDIKRLIDVLHQPVLVLDGTLRLQNANLAFLNAFNGPLDAIRNQFIYAINNQQWNSPILRELLEEILPRELLVQNFLFKHDFPDLGPRTLLLNAHKFLHGQDRHSLIMIAMLDITRHSHADKSLDESHREILRSNEELQEFALLASHDLQEPLRMIIMYLSLIERRSQAHLDAETRKYMDYAIDGANRMRSLIHDLLSYTRLRLGTDAERWLPLKRCEIGDIITRALGILEPTIENSGAVITVGKMPTVLAADLQILQVFLNLITNAIKFSTGTPHIHIDAAYEQGEWIFSVQDDGIGFREEYSKNIFELFHRLHTRAEYQGNGIGLAICKRVVEYHHGRIWAESTEGSGSTFYFTLPINPLHPAR